jgi:cell shape-determining protein MreC
MNERMKDSLDNQNQFLQNPPPATKRLIQEYVELSTQASPSETEADRLAEILNYAETDEILALWIVVADSIISRHLGLLESEHYRSYEQQYEMLKTCLSEYSHETPIEDPSEVLVSNTTNRSSSVYPATIDQVFTPEHNP